MIESMLTTVDNPHDPFTEYTAWYAFDVAAGHHTNSFLARLVKTSDDLSDDEQALDIERTIDEIVTLNVNGLYQKVTREVPDLVSA